MNYGKNVLANGRSRRKVPEIVAEPGLVLEDPASGFCGAFVRVEHGNAVLEDRDGKHRVFPMRPAAFLYEGKPVTLVLGAEPTQPERTRSASGSVRVRGVRAQVARASRIWVEGVHDAELIERVWGHDLRVEGIVVEPLHGIEDLPQRLAEFDPAPQRKVGVLVDHLVPGSKESRIVQDIDDPAVEIKGHPYVDIWAAVRPDALGIAQWPQVPKGTPWKEGVCRELGWSDPAEGWRRVLDAVSSFRDVETPLLTAVEQLIDFVTVDTNDA